VRDLVVNGFKMMTTSAIPPMEDIAMSTLAATSLAVALVVGGGVLPPGRRSKSAP
jgi:hypothetical protein